MITDESVLTDLGPRLFPLYVLFGTPTDAWDIESDRTQRVLASTWSGCVASNGTA